MSYRDEEKKIQWKLRRIKAIVFAVVFFITVALCIFSAFVPPATWKYYFNYPDLSARAAGELRMHFIDVGQGDCTLLEMPDGQVVLVDGGNGTEDSTTTIMRYLNALKIDRIDHMVLTHTDSDHCGGLDTVVKYKKVGKVYYPLQEDATTNAEYASFYAEVAKGNFGKHFNRRGLKITSTDEATPYEIVWAWPYDSGNPLAADFSGNDQSAVLWIKYGERKALLMGDATQKVEDRLLKEAAVGLLSPIGVDLTAIDLLKVSHHGSSGATSAEFLMYTTPKMAIISCGKDNAYGHPHTETMQRLAPYATTYRTDTQGNVMVAWPQSGESSTKTSF